MSGLPARDVFGVRKISLLSETVADNTGRCYMNGRRVGLAFLSVLIALMCVLLGFVTTMDYAKPQAPEQLPQVVGEIQVPEGYALVDVTSYGEYGNHFTYYCQKDGTKRIFVCTAQEIGKELVFPEGFVFVGVTTTGLYGNNYEYYCANSEGQVFVCVPKEIP